jgi:hypothetical protein
VFTTGNGIIDRYLEGVDYDLEHPLLNSTLTKNLITPVINVLDKYPITGYCLGPQNRAEYLRAHIEPKHMGIGEKTSTNDNLRKQIQAKGDGGDAVGHILGHQFGGSMRPYNVYPQNPSINSGHWTSVENHISKWLKTGQLNNANIEYQARLVYKNSESDL